MQNEKIKEIMNSNSPMDQFFQILELPDIEFIKIYEPVKQRLLEAFKSPEVRKALLDSYKTIPDINIQQEKDCVEKMLREISEDTTVCKEKKELLTLILENSISLISETIENPREFIEVKIQKISENAKLPKYAHDSDAGADVYASEEVTIEPYATELVKTGIKLSIPKGYEIQLRPRSGLSLKTNLRIANAPATIDADFRGEIGVIINNNGSTPYTINVGDRIAQMVISPVPMIKWVESDSLDKTERGENGYGSTDKS